MEKHGVRQSAVKIKDESVYSPRIHKMRGEEDPPHRGSILGMETGAGNSIFSKHGGTGTLDDLKEPRMDTDTHRYLLWNHLLLRGRRLALSPVPGEGIYYRLTGGYASLTPGYYHVTPTGFQNGFLRDRITKKTRGLRVSTVYLVANK
jgi:hypothetical protein